MKLTNNKSLILLSLSFSFSLINSSCSELKELKPKPTKLESSKNQEIIYPTIFPEEWEVINSAKKSALLALDKVADPKNKKIRSLIEKHFNVRGTDARVKGYQNFIRKLHTTIQTLEIGNFKKVSAPTIAYVFSHDKNKIIYLTRYFFTLNKNTGLNSRASVLIHEATHWSFCRGTCDYAYAGKDLMNLSSILERNNAMSWENFIMEAANY